jgi:uncharacterized DUF497 family protein
MVIPQQGVVVHPSGAEIFEWDEGNEEELGRHAVSAEEVEQVFANGPVFARNKSAGSGDWKMLGRTDGGRQLTVVVLQDETRLALRPVTGSDSTRGEMSRYFSGGQP